MTSQIPLIQPSQSANKYALVPNIRHKKKTKSSQDWQKSHPGIPKLRDNANNPTRPRSRLPWSRGCSCPMWLCRANHLHSIQPRVIPERRHYIIFPPSSREKTGQRDPCWIPRRALRKPPSHRRPSASGRRRVRTQSLAGWAGSDRRRACGSTR